MMFSVSHLAEFGILAICLLSCYPLSARLPKLKFAEAARVRFPQKVSREAASPISPAATP
jgi:hypothetical protein